MMRVTRVRSLAAAASAFCIGLLIVACSKSVNRPISDDSHVIRRIAMNYTSGGIDSLKFMFPSFVAITSDAQFIVSGYQWPISAYIPPPPLDERSSGWPVYLDVWRFDDGTHVGAFPDAGEVQGLALSPDGRYIYTWDTGYYEGTPPLLSGTLNKWDIVTREHVWSVSDYGNGFKLSADGQVLITTSPYARDPDFYVRARSTFDGSLLWEIDVSDVSLSDSKDENVISSDISPDGGYLIASTMFGGTGIWRLTVTDKSLVRSWRTTDSTFSGWPSQLLNSGVQFVNDSLHVLASRGDVAAVLDVRGEDPPVWLTVPTATSYDSLAEVSSFTNPRVTPDGEYAVRTRGGSIYVWRLEDGAMIDSWPADSSGIRHLAIHPDGRTILTVGYGRYLTISRF